MNNRRKTMRRAASAGLAALSLSLLPLTALAQAQSSQLPSNLSLTIAEGASCVGNRTVAVRLSGSNASWILLDSSDQFGSAQWQEFTGDEVRLWTLTEGDGEKTVYAMFKSSAGNVSTPVYDSVTLDSVNCAAAATTSTTEAPPAAAPQPATPSAPADALPLRYIRGASSPTVYQVTPDGMRHPILNPTIFATWMTGWNRVEWVADVSLANYPMSAPLLPKARIVLVKSPISPKVFWVEENASGPGTLRWVRTEELARALFGDMWKEAVIDLDETLLNRYNKGGDLVGLEPINVSYLLTRADLTKRVE